MNRLCLLLMLGVASCKQEERKVDLYQPYRPFGIVVEETTWNGKLESGRYTKSGIKVLKKHER
jgi:hypothetical protein